MPRLDTVNCFNNTSLDVQPSGEGPGSLECCCLWRTGKPGVPGVHGITKTQTATTERLNNFCPSFCNVPWLLTGRNSSQSCLKCSSWVLILKFGLKKSFHFFLRSTDYFLTDSHYQISAVSPVLSCWLGLVLLRMLVAAAGTGTVGSARVRAVGGRYCRTHPGRALYLSAFRGIEPLCKCSEI